MKNNTSDKGQWKLVWADEFDSEELNNNNWNRQVEEAGRFNKEWQRYTDHQKNAYIKDGCLVIEAIHEGDEHGLNQYSSARLNTAHKQTFLYGKIAARIQLPKGNGMWPAFWTLGHDIDENGGQTPWPFCGEIDILELYGSIDNAEVRANFHYADENGKHASMGEAHYQLQNGIFADDFHVFELIWDKQKMVWLVDGEVYHTKSIEDKKYAAFHQPHFLLLNIAVGGAGDAHRPNEDTVFPQRMYVDWVRVYEKV